MNRKKLAKWIFNLQIHADGEGSTTDTGRQYQKEFKKLLEAVFGVQSYFGDFFVSGLEAMDGVQDNETAFYVKTSDIPCVITQGSLKAGETRAYSTDENIAFGTGTGKSSRFGNRTEVVYKDVPVPYTWDWVFHEGLDRHTVNNNFDSAVADRLDLQAQEKVSMFNTHHAKFISECATGAGIITEAAAVTKDTVADVFNKLSAYFVNIGLRKGVTKVAKVNAATYNAIIDSGLSTTAKGSTVNIDRNEVRMFKGFVIEEVPDDLFQENESILAYAVGIGKAFTGINTARTIESEDFDGVALQGAGVAGEYILPANKKAVAKVVASGDYGLDNLTVTSAAGTVAGDTKIAVSPSLTSGNAYKYKVSDNAVLPAAGQSVKNWTAWDGASDITAATGKEIVVVECDANYLAVKGGIATVTAKA